MTIAPNGPFKVELKIAITNGETIGEISYDLPPGVVPSAETIAKAIEQSVTALPELAGANFRLMTRHEFVAQLLYERSGQHGFAIPGPDEFDIRLIDTQVE